MGHIIVILAVLSLNAFAGEYLVQLKPGYKGLIQKYVPPIESFNALDKQIIVIDEKYLDKINKDQAVEYVEPVYEVSISDSEEPLFEWQWGLQNRGNNEPRRGGGRIPIPGVVGSDSNAVSGWNLSRGSKDIIVAVVDTGIDYKHEDLKDNIWINNLELNGKKGVDDDGNGFIDDVYGYDFKNNDSDPMDDNKHGTHCAGIIGASHNQVGIAGVMARVSMMPIKFMDKKGRGDTKGAIKALTYAIENGAKVISNSWGSLGRSDIIYEIIEKAKAKNIIFVAAAGNSYLNNDNYPRYPTNYSNDNLIAVAAHDPENRLAGFSCYGETTVDLAAPGRNIMSTVPGNKYAVLSGTSMSAPFVSGAIGLLLSMNPDLGHEQIRKALFGSTEYVEHLKGKVVTDGRLDIYNLLNYKF